MNFYRGSKILLFAVLITGQAANDNNDNLPPSRYKIKSYGTESLFRHTLRDGSQGPEMVLIPPGCFKIKNVKVLAENIPGEENKKDMAPRCVGEFALGRFELNAEEYEHFARATGRRRAGGRGRTPVNDVTWEEATAYARWLGEQTGEEYRLPTETEWEYAARAAGQQIWPWGDELTPGQASCRGCGGVWDFRGPAPVGTFAAHPWGLYDLAGNVWEWTCSPFRVRRNFWGLIQQIQPPILEEKNNCIVSDNDNSWVMRGGSWFNLPEHIRTDYRTGQPARYHYSTLGLRVAWSDSRQQQTRLRIKINPPEAQILLLNPQRLGNNILDLPMGNYRLRVEHPGFIVFDQWIELNQPEQELLITLKSVAQWTAQSLESENKSTKYPLRLVIQPPNAKVVLFNPDEQPYTPGMELTRGRYLIRVSAPSYETIEQIIELTSPGVTASINLPWIEPNTGMIFIPIPAGSFLMGSPSTELNRNSDEEPLHTVTLPAFLMGKYEVTFEQWDVCIAARGCKYRPSDQGWGRNRQPVINVSWYDVEEFINWLSRKNGKRFRLPTEAEWEYATRAGTVTPYWWGKTLENARANCHGCGSSWDNIQTAPVGSFPANPWGLFDTAGNVWEWLCSAYANSYDGNETRCVGKENVNLRSLRGGSWYNLPHWMRSANRYRELPDSRNSYTGFRIVGAW